MDASAPKSVATPISGLRFQLRDVLVLVLLVALGFGWWRDHRTLTRRLEIYELQVARLSERPPRFASDVPSVFMSDAIERARQQIRDQKPPSVDEFLEAVAVPKDMSFLRMATALSSSPDREEAVPKLIQLLAHPSAQVRNRAVIAIRFLHSSPSEVVPALVPVLSDPHDPNAFEAALALGCFGSDAKPALPALKAKMRDPTSHVAAMAALSVHEIDPDEDIRPVLIDLLQSSHAKVRSQAVNELHRYFDSETIERMLIEMFARERDQSVRTAILDGLNSLAE
jgi:HEAT repeat protein